MKCVLAQHSFSLGSLKDNQQKILSLVSKYKNYDLVIFPEMALTGYPLEDILEQKHFIQKQTQTLRQMQNKIKTPAVLFGAVTQKQTSLFNSAVFIKNKKIKYFHKSFLAVSDTFDEQRFFSKGPLDKKILTLNKKNILILICEDLWQMNKNPFLKKKIDLIICINASPFFPEQLKNRKQMAQTLCRKFKSPLIYVNRTGGQDEWVFDGSSFVLNPKGETVVQLPSFKESVKPIDVFRIDQLKKMKTDSSEILLKKQALIMGIQDFVTSHSVKKVHLGLSGGVDSALTASLLVSALGSKNVTAFFLPGPYTKTISRGLSRDLAKELKINWREISIIPIYKNFVSLLKPLSPIAKENLQARIRCLILMSYSNTFPSFLIGTSNKSEIAMGYATLYGDLAGAFCPIGDLYKTESQKMLRLFFSSDTVRNILQRPPSAELSAGQVDQNDLPPYNKLDSMLKNMIEHTKPPRTSLEKKIFSRLIHSEFKRRQSPFVLKVSQKSFGRGRRCPITFRE